MPILAANPIKIFLRIAGSISLVGLIAIQGFRPAPNRGEAEGPRSLVANERVPLPVRSILRRACYDCHSNHTDYPWYAAVQPVAWWIGRHIVDAQAELNFSEYAAYSNRRASSKLQGVVDEVRERHMPLKSYLLMHNEAELSDADIAMLTDWAEDLADEIELR